MADRPSHPLPRKPVFGRILHEMITTQESESSSRSNRDVRSIVVGVEYATASRHVSQSKCRLGSPDSSTGGGRGPDFKNAALSRGRDASALGAVSYCRGRDHSWLVHAPGSRIGNADVSVHFLGLP